MERPIAMELPLAQMKVREAGSALLVRCWLRCRLLHLRRDCGQNGGRGKNVRQMHLGSLGVQIVECRTKTGRQLSAQGSMNEWSNECKLSRERVMQIQNAERSWDKQAECG